MQRAATGISGKPQRACLLRSNKPSLPTNAVIYRRGSQHCYCQHSGREGTTDKDHASTSTSSNTLQPTGNPLLEKKSDAGSSFDSSDAEVDKYLDSAWEDFKKRMKQDLDPEDVRVLETVSYQELLNGDMVMRRLANETLGPILEALGVDDDPFVFFIELIKLATFFQLITCGCLFYTAELWGHLDTGEAFRAAAGLAAGYMVRPFFKVEQLLWPLYNAALQLFAEDTTYEFQSVGRNDVQATLNKLGIFVATSFFVPQILFHWEVKQCVQFVGPLSIGLFLFDVTYMSALLLKLQSRS